MSDSEHLIENLICYVQSVGWSEVSELVNLEDIYNRYGSNGRTKIDKATFEWLLDMAVYVVYHATMGTDFSEEEK
ncbi:MAG: hypothetical protein J6S85_01795 [Methanobrevibacter sp.]|nr:hypothetical protein [Methanobrevibacter sp.]MBO7712268.1 hypothetical protein [Methanobrevibacter sp.]